MARAVIISALPYKKTIEILPSDFIIACDTGYAINYAINKGYKDVAVFGALGGLIDHTIASVQLAAGASKKDINITFFEENSVLYAVTNGTVILKKGNNRFSVFAVTDCRGVTIKNAEFCLENGTLSPLMPLGVSNRQNGETGVEVQDGTAIIISYI